MHGAGQRQTKPPTRYNPSLTGTVPVLTTDMSNSENTDIQDPLGSPSLVRTLKLIQENLDSKFGVLNNKLDDINHRVVRCEKRLEVFNAKIETLELEINTQCSALRTEISGEIVDVINTISQNGQHHQNIVDQAKRECVDDSIRRMNEVRQVLLDEITQISNRVCLVEGQAARLSALEARMTTKLNHTDVHIDDSIPIPNFPEKMVQPNPQRTFQNVFSSTSRGDRPPPHNQSSFGNTQFYSGNSSSVLVQEKLKDVVSEFNGSIQSLHPEEFLTQLDTYFQYQNVPDPMKIGIAKKRLVSDAKQWGNALIPEPPTYEDFKKLFRKYYWSYNKQLVVRTELARPHFHRDTSTLQKHAIEWINKAKYLDPPIDQHALIFQILSHFPENISSPLRILRIQTLHELIEHLSYAEYTPRYSGSYDHSNRQGTQSAPENRDPPHQQFQGRYQGRNYNRNHQVNHNHNNQHNQSSNNNSTEAHPDSGSSPGNVGGSVPRG